MRGVLKKETPHDRESRRHLRLRKLFQARSVLYYIMAFEEKAGQSMTLSQPYGVKIRFSRAEVGNPWTTMFLGYCIELEAVGVIREAFRMDPERSNRVIIRKGTALFSYNPMLSSSKMPRGIVLSIATIVPHIVRKPILG